MAIRLLAKKDVDKQKSVERQREVQEGLKLAKRVDALRETAADEEAALSSFRQKTVAEIHKEITSEAIRRDDLAKEVEELEIRKARALAPLTRETQELEDARIRLEEEKEVAYGVLRTVRTEQAKLADTEKKLEYKERVINDMHLQATQELAKTATLHGNAARLESLAEETLTSAERQAAVTLENAAQRERWVAAREDAATTKEQELRTREQALDTRETQLKDREATLARNLKRNGTSK